MKAFVKLFSNDKGEIFNFLNKFHRELSDDKKITSDCIGWEYTYENPVELADIIGTFIENNENYKINMWISIDPDILINVTDSNADDIVRYLYERFPY